MASIDLNKKSREVWERVFQKVNKSLVFSDDACVDSLHFCGGGSAILSRGAVNVKEFSSFESGGKDNAKAVFLLSKPLVGVVKDILKDIVAASSFQYIILFSAVSLEAQALARGCADTLWSSQVQEEILQFMGNMNYTVEVFFEPLCIASPCPQLFTTTAVDRLFPFLPFDVDALCSYHNINPGEIELSQLSEGPRRALKLLSWNLNSFFELLDVNEEIFSLGQTSHFVASELSSLEWAKHRRKHALHKVSLVLVDRHFDLYSAILGGDHLLDGMQVPMQYSTESTCGCNVDLSAFASWKSEPAEEIFPLGCLAGSHLTGLSVNSLEKTLDRFMETLQEMAALARIGPPEMTKVDVDMCLQAISKVESEEVKSWMAENRSKVQQLAAVSRVLPSVEHDRQWKEFARQMLRTPLKQRLQNLACAIAERNEDGKSLYSLEEVFLLLTVCYCDATSAAPLDEEERILTSAVHAAINQHDGLLPPFLQSLFDKNSTDEIGRSQMDWIFSKLMTLGRDRASSSRSREPLLEDIVNKIAAKQEVPLLKYHSTGFRDLLKSGFGLFMSSAKPRPSDCSTVVIFVVGGISWREYQTLTEGSQPTQIIVGSTTILNRSNLLENFLTQDHLSFEHV